MARFVNQIQYIGLGRVFGKQKKKKERGKQKMSNAPRNIAEKLLIGRVIERVEGSFEPNTNDKQAFGIYECEIFFTDGTSLVFDSYSWLDPEFCLLRLWTKEENEKC